MDWNHAPGALDGKLLEEGGGYDGFATGEGVGVYKGAADNGDENNGEAAAEDLG